MWIRRFIYDNIVVCVRDKDYVPNKSDDRFTNWSKEAWQIITYLSTRGNPRSVEKKKDGLEWMIKFGIILMESWRDRNHENSQYPNLQL